MPWKFVSDLRFHEVLQTTIIRRITIEIKKSKKSKNSENLLELCTNLYVHL